MPASYRFTVRGRVQGVYFRQSTADEATRLGVEGWVRNCADGSVEGVAAGPAEALERLREWLCHGPPAARVDDLAWSAAESPPLGPGFRVLR